MKNTHGEIATCEPSNIIPIIPCRYVISDDMLLTPLDELPDALQAPAGIDQSPHHQIATIRQGYIYFYGHLGGSDEHCTDAEKKWMVFRYQTRADDCNSDHEPTACASSFQYYSYQWRDGNPRREWVANPMASEPYAYINTGSRRMYIAYSEERWPAYLFTAISENPSLAEKVMQPFTLYEEDGADPHVMTLEKLMMGSLKPVEADDDTVEEKGTRPNALIEDYKGIQPENREANVLRHTPIGNLDITPIERLKRSHPDPHKNARIVVIRDTLGEAKDLLRVLEIEEANIQYYETEHHYALTTAKAIAAVDKLEQSIHRRYVDPGIQLWNNITYATRKVFSSDPFNRSADEQRHQFAAYGIEQRQKYQRLADYWKTLDQRPNVHEPAKLALQGAEQRRCEDCLGFVASQLSAYVSGVKLNALTPLAVYEKLSLDEIEGESSDASEWATLFAGMISVASEMVNQLGDSTVIERVQQVFFNVYTEVATTLFHGNSRIQLSRLETLAGVVERRVRIPTSDLNSQIHQHYEKFLTGQSSNLFASSDGQPPNGRNSGLHQQTHRFGSINVTTYDYVTDTAAGRASAGLSGIALALALFSAQKTIKDWHDHHRFDARSKAGAIANLPAVQLSVAFSTVVASYSSLRAEATFIRASQGAAQLATRFATYAIAGLPGRGYVLPQRPNLGISNAQMMERAKYARILGGLALVTGLLVSAAQGAEGYKREDYALMTGHALQGVGSLMISASLIGSVLTTFSSGTLAMVGTKLVAFGLPGVIIGGFMLATGMIFAAARRTDLEQWISEGFWGSSKRYWDDERFKEFSEQLNKSVGFLDDDNNKLITFFSQEIRAFEKLVWPITATQIEDSLVIKVEFEGLTDETDLAQLSINLENYQPRGAHGMMTGASTWARIQSHQIRREWVGPGVVSLDLSAYAEEKRLRLTVSFDRLMPDGEPQRFTMIQPLEIIAI